MIRTLGRTTRTGGAAIAVAIAAILASVAPPAQAGEPVEPESKPAPATDPVRIDFGNGITGSVDPESSRMTSITTPTPLQWDLDAADRDFYGFGMGWTLGTYTLQGTMFYIPGVGSYEYDESQPPSNLHGYEGTDFVAQGLLGGQPVVLPPRGDIPEQEAWWTLTQASTGITAYFSWVGQLIATIDDSGARTDWVFEDQYDHGSPLERIVEPNGDTIHVTEPPSTGEVAVLMPDGIEYYLTLQDEKVWSVVTAEQGRTSYTTTSIDSSSPWNPNLPQSFVETLRHDDGAVIAHIKIYWRALAPRGTVTRISDGSTDLYPVPTAGGGESGR